MSEGWLRANQVKKKSWEKQAGIRDEAEEKNRGQTNNTGPFNGISGKSCKQRTCIIKFIFQEDHLSCNVEHKSEGSKTRDQVFQVDWNNFSEIDGLD